MIHVTYWTAMAAEQQVDIAEVSAIERLATDSSAVLGIFTNRYKWLWYWRPWNWYWRDVMSPSDDQEPEILKCNTKVDVCAQMNNKLPLIRKCLVEKVHLLPLDQNLQTTVYRWTRSSTWEHGWNNHGSNWSWISDKLEFTLPFLCKFGHIARSSAHMKVFAAKKANVDTHK